MTPTPNTSVSHGTLNSEHLIPVFAALLRQFSLDGRFSRELLEAEAMEGCGFLHVSPHDALCLRCELEDALDTLSPEGCYFGLRPDSDANFGWWAIDPTDTDFDFLTVLSQDNP